MSQLAFVIPEKGAQPSVTTTSIPKIKGGEVLIKVLSAAVNPHENVTIDMGLFAESYPYTLGTDGAGVIEEVGPGVTNLKKGDKVVVHGDLFDRETCTDQQYAKAEAVFVAKVPDNITLDQACTLPVAIIAIVVGYYHKTGLGLTPPWTADGLGKYKGESIFIPGGASSVGQFAIQLARLSGFSIIATTASEHNHDLVKSLGATHVFPRTTSAADIKAAIGPVKLSLDSISKADTQALSLAVLEKAEGSHLILCGWPTEDTKTKAAPINARIILGSSMRTRDVSVPFWAVVEDWLRDGTIKPTAVEVLPGGLAAIGGALDRLKKGEVSGKKLVVRPQETEAAK